jgi:hypothetical protein
MTTAYTGKGPAPDLLAEYIKTHNINGVRNIVEERQDKLAKQQQTFDISKKMKGDGWSPLELAAIYDDVDIIEVLVKARANIDGNIKCSPLLAASHYGLKKAVKRLLTLKADPNLHRPLYIILAYKQNIVEENLVEIVKSLVTAKADVDPPHESTLFAACSINNIQVVQYLIANGANVTKALSRRLEYSKNYCRPEVDELLAQAVTEEERKQLSLLKLEWTKKEVDDWLFKIGILLKTETSCENDWLAKGFDCANSYEGSLAKCICLSGAWRLTPGEYTYAQSEFIKVITNHSDKMMKKEINHNKFSNEYELLKKLMKMTWEHKFLSVEDVEGFYHGLFLGEKSNFEYLIEDLAVSYNSLFLKLSELYRSRNCIPLSDKYFNEFLDNWILKKWISVQESVKDLLASPEAQTSIITSIKLLSVYLDRTVEGKGCFLKKMKDYAETIASSSISDFNSAFTLFGEIIKAGFQSGFISDKESSNCYDIVYNRLPENEDTQRQRELVITTAREIVPSFRLPVDPIQAKHPSASPSPADPAPSSLQNTALLPQQNFDRNCEILFNFTKVISDQKWNFSDEKYRIDLTELNDGLCNLLKEQFEKIVGKQLVIMAEDKILVLNLEGKHFRNFSDKSKDSKQILINALPKSPETRLEELKERLVALGARIKELISKEITIREDCQPYFDWMKKFQNQNDKDSLHKKRKVEDLRKSYDKFFSEDVSSLQTQSNSLREKLDSLENLEGKEKEIDTLSGRYDIFRVRAENISTTQLEASKWVTQKDLHASTRVVLIEPKPAANEGKVPVVEQPPPKLSKQPPSAKKEIPKEATKPAKSEPPRPKPSNGKEEVPTHQTVSDKEKAKFVPSVSSKGTVVVSDKSPAKTVDLEIELPKLTKTKKDVINEFTEFDGSSVTKFKKPSSQKIVSDDVPPSPSGMRGVATDNYDLLENFEESGQENKQLWFYASCYELMRMFHVLGALPHEYHIEFFGVNEVLNIRNNIIHHLTDLPLTDEKIGSLNICISFLKKEGGKFKSAMQNLKSGIPVSPEQCIALREIPFLHDILVVESSPRSLEKDKAIISQHIDNLIQYAGMETKREEQFHQEGTLHSAIKMSIAIIGEKIKKLPQEEKNRIYNLLEFSDLDLWDKKKGITIFEKLRTPSGHDLNKGAEQSPVTFVYEEISSFVLRDIIRKSKELKTLLSEFLSEDPKNLSLSASRLVFFPHVEEDLSEPQSLNPEAVPFGQGESSFPSFIPLPFKNDSSKPPEPAKSTTALNPTASSWRPPR